MKNLILSIRGYRKERERMVSRSAKYPECLHVIDRIAKLKKKSWKSWYMIKDVTK